MARRKKKGPIDDLFDVLPGITILLLFYLWSRTGNIPFVITIYALIVIALFGTGFFLWRRRKKIILASGIDQIDTMSGQMFEQLLLEYFRKLGYKGKTTAETSDYGSDLLLMMDQTKYVVQAKRWNQNVGIEAIQQIIGAIRFYGADQGMVITNSYFTNNAKKLAQVNNIELWGRNKLIDLLSQVQGSEIVEDLSTEGDHSFKENNCPRCGARLVLRSGSRGKFYGCYGFPKCRYTQNYN